MPINYLRFLFVDQIAERLNSSKGSIWRWAKERPEFPKPVKIGKGITRWRSADLDQFESTLPGAQ